MPKHSTSEIELAMKTYDVNEPQAKAILGALEVKGFALIQGYVHMIPLTWIDR